MGEVWKQKKVKESSEKQEDYQKVRKSGSETRCTNREGWRSFSGGRGDLGTDGGRGGPRLEMHETQDKKGNRNPKCQADTEQR